MSAWEVDEVCWTHEKWISAWGMDEAHCLREKSLMFLSIRGAPIALFWTYSMIGERMGSGRMNYDNLPIKKSVGI
eukprot:1155081-Pelagomonas_calceolata.AAC.2